MSPSAAFAIDPISRIVPRRDRVGRERSGNLTLEFAIGQCGVTVNDMFKDGMLIWRLHGGLYSSGFVDPDPVMR